MVFVVDATLELLGSGVPHPVAEVFGPAEERPPAAGPHARPRVEELLLYVQNTWF